MIKTVKYFSLIILVLILISIVSCSKDKRTVYDFPEDLKPYCMFKKGSYWIYRNDMTGVEDSSFLLSTPTPEPIPYSETGPIYYYLNSFFGGEIIHSLFAGFNWNMKEYILTYSFMYNDGYLCIISNHIENGYSEKDSHSIYRVIGIDDTLTIGNTVYKNVLTTQFTRDLYYQSVDSVRYTYFFDKVHGLVRFVRRSGGADTTWSLMRSHVLK